MQQPARQEGRGPADRLPMTEFERLMGVAADKNSSRRVVVISFAPQAPGQLMLYFSPEFRLTCPDEKPRDHECLEAYKLQYRISKGIAERLALLEAGQTTALEVSREYLEVAMWHSGDGKRYRLNSDGLSELYGDVGSKSEGYLYAPVPLTMEKADTPPIVYLRCYVRSAPDGTLPVCTPSAITPEAARALVGTGEQLRRPHKAVWLGTYGKRFEAAKSADTEASWRALARYTDFLSGSHLHKLLGKSGGYGMTGVNAGRLMAYMRTSGCKVRETKQFTFVDESGGCKEGHAEGTGTARAYVRGKNAWEGRAGGAGARGGGAREGTAGGGAPTRAGGGLGGRRAGGLLARRGGAELAGKQRRH